MQTITEKDYAAIVDEAACKAPGVVLVEQMAPRRFYLELRTENPAHRLVVEVGAWEWDGRKSKNSTPWRWYREGYTPEVLETYWNINTYYTDERGDCRGWYNPTVKLHESGTRMTINFDWELPATAENLARILREIKRREREGVKVER
jgi:hypothetical protein